MKCFRKDLHHREPLSDTDGEGESEDDGLVTTWMFERVYLYIPDPESGLINIITA